MDKENLVNSARTQMCFKCYYDDGLDDYDMYAVIRCYDDMDWSIQKLDSMLETSNFSSSEELTQYLSEFNRVEEVSLEIFLEEVLKVNKDLERWGL